MKIINREKLVKDVSLACINANLQLTDDVIFGINKLKSTEDDERALSIISQIEQNLELSKTQRIPMCQDTGIVIGVIRLGNNVQYDFDIYEAINEGIRIGYNAGNLRKSVVSDPLKRINSGDNTPGIFHVELVQGEEFEITLAPKGAGSENMSNLKMFNPQTPIEQIKTYIVDVIKNAKGKPCPPIIVGVGIGGTFEKAAIMAKEAVLKPVGQFHNDEFYAEIEKDLIQRINDTGIGPMGLGGKSTCIDVHIKQYASHIASLAVAVNIQCHVARHQVVKY